MAISKHPITGVPVNEITVKRKWLTEEDAITIHLMRLQGATYTDIVHHMGTNANRVGEVLRGEIWPNAAEKARAILGGDLFIRH